MVGNISKYTRLDVLRAFIALRDEKKSRKELSDSLEIGEGTLRSILDKLKQKKLIESTQQGHKFTKKGEGFYKELLELIDPPKKVSTSFYKNKKQTGLLLKNRRDVKIGIEKRDIAIKHGADGAIILKFRERLFFPDMEYETKDFDMLEKQFDLEKNNILIITYSDTTRFAELSAIGCAAAINPELEKLVEKLD